ncbi:thioredoxin, partial [Klebsiella variicola]
TLRRSPKLFRVAESAFRPISAASELEGERPVLLFVGAERCVHCRKLWQLLAHEKLSQRIAQFETRYLDADLHQELASDLGVRGLPTLLLITSGQPISRAPTQYSVASLLNWLNSVSL